MRDYLFPSTMVPMRTQTRTRTPMRMRIARPGTRCVKEGTRRPTRADWAIERSFETNNQPAANGKRARVKMNEAGSVNFVLYQVDRAKLEAEYVQKDSAAGQAAEVL